MSDNDKQVLLRGLLAWTLLVTIGTLIGIFSGALFMNLGARYFFSVFLVPVLSSGAFGWFATQWVFSYVTENWEKQ